MIWAFIFVLWPLKLDDRPGDVYGTLKNRVGSCAVVGVVVGQRWQKACGLWENMENWKNELNSGLRKAHGSRHTHIDTLNRL